MPRLMSVAHTTDSVRNRTKTVTRRLGWASLRPGEVITLCPKVMGRRRGDGTVEPLVRLCDVEVVSVRREPLSWIDDADVVAEGVPVEVFDVLDADTEQPPPWEWVRWFAASMGCGPHDIVTRIEFRYLDGGDRG